MPMLRTCRHMQRKHRRLSGALFLLSPCLGEIHFMILYLFRRLFFNLVHIKTYETCVGCYVSVTVRYDETVVVVRLAVKLAVRSPEHVLKLYAGSG